MNSSPTKRSRFACGLVICIAGCLLLGVIGEAAAADARKVKLRENQYYYSAFNKRDPFRSLISGDFVRQAKMTIIDLGSVELVGIIKGELDRFALLEDEKGYNYILRVGDRVRNGSVVAIGEQTMVARVTNYGQTTKFTMHLTKREEGVQK